MSHIIRYQASGQAPQVTIDARGGVRIRYHVALLSPNGNGEIVKEWRGSNWDNKEDRFSMPISGATARGELAFAPLYWRFDVLPNPGMSGEKLKISFHISQDAVEIFSKEYEKTGVAAPEFIDEEGIFTPVFTG